MSERAAPVMATSMPNGTSSFTGTAASPEPEVSRCSFFDDWWDWVMRVVALDAASRRSRSSARKSVYWGIFLSRSPSL